MDGGAAEGQAEAEYEGDGGKRRRGEGEKGILVSFTWGNLKPISLHCLLVSPFFPLSLCLSPSLLFFQREPKRKEEISKYIFNLFFFYLLSTLSLFPLISPSIWDKLQGDK